MKTTSFKKIIDSEVFKYLFFGVLATLVYMFVRLLCFSLTKEATLSALVANVVAVMFAFITNDIFVFNQIRAGWFNRLIKFSIARIATLLLDLALAYLLVEKFPNIIGQFVNHNISLVNAVETIIGQVLVIALNYVFSKLFIFKNSK